MQQDVHNSTDMRVSAIPLTPVRTRDRERSNGYHVDHSTPIQYGTSARSAASAPRFEDIMNERPDPSAMYHQSLPEDHLEDILTLPIAAELKSRRSKASLAASDRTTSTTAFPSSSTQSTRRQGAVSATNIHGDGARDQADMYNPNKRNESLRKRSKSSPMRADSPNSSLVDLSSPPLPNDYDIPPNQSVSFNSTNDRKTKTPALSPSSRNYPPQTPPSTSSSKLRNRAVTNNVANSNTRKLPHLNGSASGSRRPLQATNTSSSRQVSTPLKKPSASTPPSRLRSSSTSLLSSSIHHDWDENSKPPWLDESPAYLYKSDIEGIQPGSLADIARHAQGRSQTSTGADGDASFQGDTSVRSWDDVILPAVAKQIRAQQILEMQKNAQNQRNGNDGQLVTDWDADGIPRKWQRVSGKNTNMTDQEGSPAGVLAKELSSAESRALHSPARERRRTRSSTYSESRSAGKDEQRSYANPSLSSRYLGVQQGQLSAAVDSHTMSDASRSSHQTGRKELWDHPPLGSTGNTSRTGVTDFQVEHSFAARAEPRPHSYLDGPGVQETQAGPNEEQQHSALNESKNEDGHKGGCCKCIIM